MWKETDDETLGEDLKWFAKDAVCNLGMADWHGQRRRSAKTLTASSGPEGMKNQHSPNHIGTPKWYAILDGAQISRSSRRAASVNEQLPKWSLAG
jgi:hypothetical protein